MRSLQGALALASALAASPLCAQAEAGRWLRCNTHTHTADFVGSDADVPALKAASWYKAHGYQCVVITDHEHLTSVAPLNARLADGTFLVLPGEEVSQVVKDASQPGGRRYAHVNGLGVTRRILSLGFPPQWDYPAPAPAPWAGGSVADAFRRNIAEIRAQGALAQINHPNGGPVGLADVLDLEGPYLLEIPGAEPLWDQLLSRGKVVWGVASDDAHHYRTGASGPSTPGRGWIFIKASQLRAEAIWKALRNGDFYASNGVRLKAVNVTRRGMSLEIALPPTSEGGGAHRADAFRTEFIGAGGVTLATVQGSKARYGFHGDETYVRAVVTDAEGHKAWTQPVFRDDRTAPNPPLVSR